MKHYYYAAVFFGIAMLSLLAGLSQPVSAGTCLLDSNCAYYESCDWLSCQSLSCANERFFCTINSDCGADWDCKSVFKILPSDHACVGGNIDRCFYCKSPTQADCDRNGGCETNTYTDAKNCGSCGNNCATKSAYCSGGKYYTYTGACTSSSCVVKDNGYIGPCCADANPSTPNPCVDGCYNFQTDSNNCGRCRNYCTSGKSCVSGECTCPAGSSACLGGCFNFQTDSSNCGGCGNDCTTSGRICVSGSCHCSAGTYGAACSDGGTKIIDCGAYPSVTQTCGANCQWVGECARCG